ncbi:alpha/beta hydrolase [Halobacteriovorax sp. GB3]|uniref:alpha/beta fold hydrolase n=1 Tax=Halobacteriovorax sp. GB3 TaxID=2719615 RepID=UPI0023614F46|nr:alpha/beta hydrolase [Halobacteriovorax sp. GB3]MDD0854016.1 alpha/beta hydrolase [Halobacteriovorax sp. GB3]
MRILILLLLVSCSAIQHQNTETYDKELTGYQYPFKVDFFNFQSQNQDLKMAYMDLNSTSDKAIVLLHGKNFAGFYWERIASDLVEKGYRVIIPDQIGFGKSSKPNSYQFSFYNLALNTKKLLEKLKIEKSIIVGHSMGGMLATHFTYLYPQAVKKLVMINPIGLEPYLKYVEFKDPSFFYRNELKKTPEKAKAYQRKNYYDGKWKSEYDKLLYPYNKQMQSEDWPKVAWSNALTYGPIFSEDITTKFKDIKNEVILVIGTRDKTGPGRNWKKDGVTRKLGEYHKLGKKAHKSFENSKLYELKGLGHMPQFEDYERFSRVFFKDL